MGVSLVLLGAGSGVASGGGPTVRRGWRRPRPPATSSSDSGCGAVG
ncbi:hypothetical protein Cus16_2255 [Curtobacterium sp. ER1/6]|nr:hypothetical protein Cus16_2255 [Curtobacterium sp. ER1/6]